MMNPAQSGKIARSMANREGAVGQDMGKSLSQHQVIHADTAGSISSNQPLVAIRNEMLSGTGAKSSRRVFTTEPNANKRFFVGEETPFSRRMRVRKGDINVVHRSRA